MHRGERKGGVDHRADAANANELCVLGEYTRQSLENQRDTGTENQQSCAGHYARRRCWASDECRDIVLVPVIAARIQQRRHPETCDAKYGAKC